MSRISKTQIYAVQWLSSQNKNPQEIADELKVSLEQVNTILEKHTTQKDTSSIKTKKSSVVNSKSKNLMITETSAKKNNHVAIMTKEASEYNDSLRNKTTRNNPNTEKAIFRPKKND